MSENPFATPEPVSGNTGPKVNQKAPGGLTALLIICLVDGNSGIARILSGCWRLWHFRDKFKACSKTWVILPSKRCKRKSKSIQNQQMIPEFDHDRSEFHRRPIADDRRDRRLESQTLGHTIC